MTSDFKTINELKEERQKAIDDIKSLDKASDRVKKEREIGYLQHLHIIETEIKARQECLKMIEEEMKMYGLINYIPLFRLKQIIEGEKQHE